MRQPIIYTILFVLLTASGCSFIANANEESGEKTDIQVMYDVRIETDISEFEEYHMTAHYPQTPNNQIDQTIIDYVNQQKALFKQESYKSKQKNDGSQAHELHIDFEVIHQNQRFFVVRFIETMDLGAGGVMTNQTIMNFDKKNGKALSLEELFKEDIYYVDRLHEWTKEKMGDAGEGNSQLMDKVEAKPEFYEDVAFTGEGLLVFIDAPASQEPYRVMIEKDKVSRLLRSEYTDAFIEAPDVVDNTTSEDKGTDNHYKDFSLDNHLHGERKEVALTFDDGPHPEVTREILDVLDKYEAKASFFMIGKRVGYYPEVAREVSERGHEIGNHTWNHPRLGRLSDDQINQQLTSTQTILEQVTGQKVDLLRLPFGNLPSANDQEENIVAPWTIYSEEWEDLKPETVAEDILSEMEGDSIVLLHDLQHSTVETVDLLLKGLYAEGYEVVPVGHIIDKQENRSVFN
ncbi:polysaccharide deacetylase family protein [Halobacillus faecis]|uniref:Peptidoglycan-N-acetylmuramic acid deacetylase PdaC n=1 Tax=Halobacillus faecis TaxID=360184 RepID=A0A511WQJ4_9BACI|nr:polysaccharide deacetylase family protein [Halobacillus faecis]GEN53414.1 peptidoglycan-N-acetylmuramic acid deacetylase PdaC [Halobacillus faecis]